MLILVISLFETENFVTCGSAIKIKHQESKYYLNSEQKNLNSGSGQQIVTFVKDPGTHDTLWWVRPAHHNVANQEYPANVTTCNLAEPVKCGSMIRLTHVETMRNLHSHGVQSPLSRQQEVTGYGTGDGKGDGGDNWRVECVENGGGNWVRNKPVRLFHIDTQKYLGTAKNVEFNAQNCGQNCPIM